MELDGPSGRGLTMFGMKDIVLVQSRCLSVDMRLHLECRFAEGQMGCVNRAPLRHFGRSPVVLVPLTEWGIVAWIGLALAKSLSHCGDTILWSENDVVLRLELGSLQY